MRVQVDRRVLGGFICQDTVTKASVLNPLVITAPQLTVRPNRSGVYVIFNAPGMTKFIDTFAPAPPAPNAAAFEISIKDPGRRYLSRRVTLQFPRSLPPAADPSTLVFSPYAVQMYPSVATSVMPSWGVIHVSVVRTGVAPLKGRPWSLVQVTRKDNSNNIVVLASTITDARGEGLLAIPGLGPEVSGSETGAVTNTNIAITITAGFDPNNADPPDTWIPDPDDLLNKLAKGSLTTGTLTDQIAPGQILNRTLAI